MLSVLFFLAMTIAVAVDIVIAALILDRLLALNFHTHANR